MLQPCRCAGRCHFEDSASLEHPANPRFAGTPHQAPLRPLPQSTSSFSSESELSPENNSYLAGPSPCPCPGVDTPLNGNGRPPLRRASPLDVSKSPKRCSSLRRVFSRISVTYASSSNRGIRRARAEFGCRSRPRYRRLLDNCPGHRQSVRNSYPYRRLRKDACRR